MKSGLRELALVTLVCVTVSLYLRQRNSGPVLSEQARAAEGDPEEFIVWKSESPVGQTWGNLGPRGKIEFAGEGIDGKGKALSIRMSGDGYRGCGLNWKGWFPENAGDDVSKYRSLVFHIRQVTKEYPLDIGITLIDNVKRTNSGVASNVVNVVGDGGVERIDDKWRKVILPLSKFKQNKPLRLDRLWEIDFGHEGKADIAIQIDRIGFSMELRAAALFPARPDYKAEIRLDLSGEGHRINDGIYGVCTLPGDKLRDYGITITRWGGNPSSRYNWKINADNGANDWYFKNRGAPIRELTDSGYLKHIRAARSRNSTTYQTVPMLGWVAKDNTSYGYSVKKYGAQQSVEPGYPDVGNGLTKEGKPILDADPKDTSIEVGPDFIGECVAFLVKQAGSAEKDGVKYWVLDNEPMLWHETHRDVRPKPLGYDELWERTVKYAEAIKKADPTAKVAGFCSWGWTDLFYSALDEGGDRYTAKKDHKAHDGMPLAEWFIRQCGEYKKKNGKSLIDVFDCHWYPQGQVGGKTPFMGKGMNPALNELRLRSTRDLWDPDYTQESWIKNSGDRKPTQVIRRVKQWIEKHNPGMELCLGEYNFGGSDNVTGGLAQADVFGILAREKVDLAFIWSTPQGTQELAWQLFRNYDGAGGRFGEQFNSSANSGNDISVYAAKRKDGATTIVVINKNLGGACDLKLEAPGLKGELRVWRFDQTSGSIAKAESPGKIDGSIELKLPAASASLLEIK
jgi:hypothetical protein